MKLNILLCGFIFLIFELSCKEAIIQPEPLNSKIKELKSTTFGTKYYVALTGSDNNAGTLALPFRTIQKAANTAAPGDSVIVRDGTYTFTGEYMNTLWGSGTAVSYITIISEHKWGAVLDGLGVSSHCFNLTGGVSYLTISGFEIKNFLWDALILNNPLNPNTNINIQDNHIHDIGRECTDTPSGHNGIYIHKANSIIFERNIFHDIGRYAPNENACVPATPFYQNHDHGLYIDGCNGLIARYNIFYNMQRGWGVHIYSSSGSASSNISILNNTFAFGNPYKDGGQIILAGTLTNSKIVNNIFYGQVSAGISVDTKPTYSNISISNNISYGGEGFIVTNTPSGVSLSNNIVNTDVKMVNPGKYDFRLQITSPGINAGANVGLTSDFLGNPIIGLPDIGAYESAASIPIIGLNTIGGISEKGDNGFWIANSFTAGSSITVNRMNLFVATASGNARLGIYSNSSGEPGTLLAQTNDIVLSNGWNGAMLGSSLNLTAGTTYWLAFEVSSPTTTLYYNSALSMQRYITYVYGPLPAAAPLKCASGSGAYSIFADYSGIAPTSVTGVSISPASAGILVGGTQQLTATVSPANATNKTVTWSSGNSSIATVNTTGLVTGVAAGSATITATTQDGSKKASCTVAVTAVSITLPTLGLNTVGGLSEKGINGYWIANSFTAGSNMTVSKMNLFVATASGNARLGIYSSNGSEPGTLLTQTGDVLLTNGWNSSSLGTSLNLISGVTYWLAIEINSSATTLQYNTATGRQRYIPYIYGSLPSSAPLKCSSGTGIYSVFAN